MNIFKPDTCLTLLNVYHKTNFIMIPLATLSYVEEKVNKTSLFYNMFICNISYHSYVSCSAILTDYIKQNTLKNGLRSGNLSLHLLSTYGYIYSSLKN